MNGLLVYNTTDNADDLVLVADGIPQSLTAITRVKLTVNGTVIDSLITPTAITWPQSVTYRGAAAQAIRFKLGAAALLPGIYADSRLMIFEPATPNGVVWTDGLAVRVKA